ncbi:hypothetical protein ACFXJ5_40345 [Streptomyces sp. NPDC059373]
MAILDESIGWGVEFEGLAGRVAGAGVQPQGDVVQIGLGEVAHPGALGHPLPAASTAASSPPAAIIEPRDTASSS